MEHDITRRIAALSATKRELLEQRLREEHPAAAKELVAYLVPQDSHAPSEAELRAYMRGKLPEYMVPSAFVLLDKLPLMPSGKLDRRALPAPGQWPGAREQALEMTTAPRSELERLIAGIWEEVLQRGSVGVEDDFFALGGHSLAATQVVSRLRAVLGTEVPVSVVFEAPTVAELAERLGSSAAPGRKPEAPPLVRISQQGAAPLSFAQQRLWFLDQLQPGSAAYNLPAALRLRGPLDVPALERSFAALASRHETLRTTFSETAGQPWQAVHPAGAFPLPVTDLTALDAAERAAELERRMREEAGRPFDLSRGPLMRAELLRLGETEHVLLCTLHHIVADGWSVGVLMRELSALYQDMIQARAPGLADLPVQYADYAVWQRDWLSSGGLEDQLAYWKQQLADAPAALELPADRPRPAVQRFAGRRLPLALSRELTDELRALCRQEGVTLFMALLAALATLLARYARQRDILIGTPIANRNRVEIEGLIGCFVNTLVLRTDLTGAPTVRELLQRVRATTLAAYAHQDLPFERLVDALGLQRELSRTPLFQVMLVLENDPQAPLELPGLDVQEIEIEGTTAKFDLTVTLAESPGGLRGSIEYNSDLFDPPTIERMAGHLCRLLASMVAGPAANVFRLPMLDAAEEIQLVADLNPTRAFPDGPPLHRRFEEQAARVPDAIALVFEDRRLSYRELNRRANRLAIWLRARGAGPGSLVALCLERSPDMVTAILAVLKAGAAYVPIEPSHPPSRIAFVLEDCGAPLLLSERGVAERLPACAAQVVFIDELAEQEERDATSIATLTAELDDNPPGGAEPHDPAYLIYTSGSTGQPKGVLVTHSNVVRLMNATYPWYRFDETDVWTLFHSYAFDMSVFEIWGALAYGGRLVVVPYWVSRSFEDFYRLLGAEGVTVLNQTPSAFRALIQAEGALGVSDALGLRLVVFGGEALELQSLAPWFERHGDNEPRLVNMYGITETTVHVTYRPITLADLDGSSASVIGAPIPDLQVYLLDEYQELVPVGVPGEIYVGGPGVALGYLGRPGLTGQRFVPDRFSGEAGARLYRSGDLARRLPDGDLEYLGRIDLQVKIRGFRVETGEIEAALTRHPEVRDVAVVAYRRGGGEQSLAAYIVPDQGQGPAASELRSFLKEHLPEYMVPSAFVTLDSLPLTGNGKLDKRALPAPESAASDVAEAGQRPLVAPRTDAERALVQVWSTILHRDRISIHDNFFELGGDSLLAIQMVALARRAGLEVSPRQLFRHQSIAELAAVAGTVPSVVAEQGEVVGPVPLTPVQRWFFEQPLDVPGHWNQAMLLELGRPYDAAVLARAVHELIAHHDALRLRFCRTEAGWEQRCTAVVAETATETPPFQDIDLSGHPEPVRALEETAATLQASLDLAEGPLFRVALVHFAADRGDQLLLIAHHLVVDAVSWRVLLEDLFTACEQIAAGRDAALPAKTTSFKVWVERLVQYAGSPDFAGERAYWDEQPWAEAEPLPVDGHGQRTERAVRSLEVFLDESQTEALLHEVPEAYRTRTEEVLLAALGEALGRSAQVGRCVIAMEGHGREALFDGVDLSRTVGWFTSIFPVLLDCRPGRRPQTALKAIKEQLRRLPHRGIGYGVLRYLSAGDTSGKSSAGALRAGNLAPEPQLCFNYLGRIDRALPGNAPFALARGSIGPERAPGNARRYLLDVTAQIVDRRLQVIWSYDSGAYREDTIAALSHAFFDALAVLMEHCLSPDAGGYTPSDFPLIELEQAELDRITGRDRSIEDMYPLSPMQQGFWLYGQYDGGAGVEQVRFVLEGRLNRDAFARAWQTVVDRHAVLRTGFVSPDPGQPLQRVARQARLPIAVQSLRGQSDAEQRGWLETFRAQDLRRGFDLDTPPLMRLTVLELAEDRHQIVWSHHHLLLDGWSVPIVIREVITCYEAFVQDRTPQLDTPRRFRDYIAWHRELDLAATRSYWQRELAGLRAPTPLMMDRLPDGTPEDSDAGNRAAPGHREESLVLSAADTAALDSFVRRHKLSLGTVLQAAWARVLSVYSGERDVIFGTTVSGRPPDLDGVDAMVGMFINVVPVRVRLALETRLGDWLAEFHARQLEQRQHEHTPLLQIQQWSEVSADRLLFDSLLVVENYPTRIADVQEGAGTELARGVAIREVDAPVRTRYRLTLVAVPGHELSLYASYDSRHLATTMVERCLQHLRAVLTAFVAAPEALLGEVSILSAAERDWLDRQDGAEKLLDAEGRPAPVGIPGQVHDRDTLRPTGRMARCLPDGRWQSLGARDDVMMLGGQRVLPAEIAALIASAPHVSDCVVAVDAGAPVAYIVPTQDARPDRRRLNAYLRERLAAPFIPGAFVLLSTVPRTAEGAIDRARLPAPAPEDFIAGGQDIAPRTATEKALASIWSELVGGRGVGARDDFFELGGQSLLAIQMLSRVRSTLGVALPMQVVFSERTLERISRWIDAHGTESSATDDVLSPFERHPLRRLPERETYDLSPYQLPEWYFSRVAPDSPMYNILSCDILLEGELDLDVMARAWQLLLNRHKVFRTSFGWHDGTPVQRIGPALTVTREDIYLDYTDTPEDEFIEVSTKLAHEYADTTFDFSRSPIFRLKLAEFPGKRFLLLFLTNHILWDEVSSMNMVSELKEAYNALRSGRTPDLPELEVDYVDYAHWVNSGVEAGIFERERRYWIERFAVAPPPLELPGDFPRPPQLTFNGSDIEGRLPPDTRARLDEFLQEHPGLTMSMVLHAAFSLLLYRLSGQDDLVIGVPVANRGDQRLEGVIGPFATAMPMRSTLDPDMTFAELLETTRLETVEALDNYAYPSVLAIQQINPQWDMSRGRLFQVMYGLQHNKTKFWDELHLDGARTRRMAHLANIGPLHSTARTDIRLIVEELGEEILFSLSYSADLFKRSTAERMARQYIDLLDHGVRRPETRLAAFSLLSADERTLLVEEVNATAEPLPIDSSIGRRIEEQAARTPGALAMVFEDRRWSYEELNAEANRWAHRLGELGVGLEDRVGVLFEPCPEMVIAILAVLKRGAAYVPLHPEQPAARWDTILAAAGARVLLSHDEVDTAGMLFSGTRLMVRPGAAEPWPATNCAMAVPPRACAVVFFTSGSTGVPKGIEVEHRGVLNLIESTQRAYDLKTDDAILLCTPYTFDVSMLDMFWPLMTGARLVVPKGTDGKTPSRIAALVDKHRVAFLQCVPLMLAALVDGRQAGEVSAMEPLRAVMCAGAVLTRELYERCTTAFSFFLANHYGPTEASVDASRFDPRSGFHSAVVPIGKPISNTRMYVLDRRLEPAAIGVTGELYIAGIGLARGYLGDPAKTAAAFIPDPFATDPGARMYRTGDLARFDDRGVLHFVGRVDRQVKVRGNRVEIEEVETRLSAHPAVRRCVVQHKRHEDGSDFLVAYLDFKDDVNSFMVGTGEDARRLGLFTLAQRPELKRPMDVLHSGAWPEYFAGDEVQQAYWPRLAAEMARTQLALVDGAGEVVAVGNAVPICWDGTVDGLPQGWDGGLEKAFQDAAAGAATNTLLVLSGVVAEDHAGTGLSAFILRAFKALARGLGLAHVIVPVRPTGKVDHPEVSFATWCELRRPDGLPVDPWLRVHERLQAKWLKIELRSQRVWAPIERWEEWSGRRLERSGSYDLKGTLQPVEVSMEDGGAEYFDPSVWMEHPLDAGPADRLDPVDGAALRDFLRQFLPEYMIPEHYRFLSEMPLTASGKINEQALPEFQLAGAGFRSLPPQTPLQAQIAAVLASVLGIDEVGILDDFFTIGGNSLKALQLLAVLADQYGVSIPPREFFKDPTVKALARALEDAQ